MNTQDKTLVAQVTAVPQTTDDPQKTTQKPDPKNPDDKQPVDKKTPIHTKIIGKYRVEVINEKCIGAASCVAIAPNTFILNEENIAEVISQDGDPDDIKLLGAQSCPTAAIYVYDTETGKQVWPREDI